MNARDPLSLALALSILALVGALVNLYLLQQQCVGTMWSIAGPAIAVAVFGIASGASRQR